MIYEVFLKMIPLFVVVAMGESDAAEETVSGGPEERGDSPASDQVLVGPSPPSCVRHPADRQELPPSQAPEEGSAGDCPSSGTAVRGFGFTDEDCFVSSKLSLFHKMFLTCAFIFTCLYLQALWRGHRSRRLNDNAKLVKLRHRLRQVSAAVREEDKLCNKTSSALEYLLRYKHFSDILEALKNLGKTSHFC